MKTSIVVFSLALASHAAAHGYVYSINADNTVYPGWDVYIDQYMQPKPARIAFGGGGPNPIFNVDGKELACNFNPTAPGAIAEVRAGSDITFHWSRWLYSHKGPITAWLAPYEGDVAKVDVNKLEFFKITEDTVDDKGVWANVRMMDDKNMTWTATIPADIKPGTYVLRHEVSSGTAIDPTP
ncbi:glycoside hydrolase [Cercophora newfieldiana]|uniref:lytic cellulose monooxygenase (C4-dehydrogenating) n=1 Tax=Cercophora newfieldiana TaxID=92897 RepID=A0AA40CXT8_9PEZI|nr:glycoside hydrolase [Cercophora newfieldiana]